MISVEVRQLNSTLATCIWIGLVIYIGMLFSNQFFAMLINLFAIQFPHSVNHVLTIKLTSHHSHKVLLFSQLVFIPFAIVLLHYMKENQGPFLIFSAPYYLILSCLCFGVFWFSAYLLNRRTNEQ